MWGGGQERLPGSKGQGQEPGEDDRVELHMLLSTLNCLFTIF